MKSVLGKRLVLCAVLPRIRLRLSLGRSHFPKGDSHPKSESNALLVLLDGWQTPCPWACKGGMEQTPSGMMRVTIPNGLRAGQGFRMMVPEAAPQLVLHL